MELLRRARRALAAGPGRAGEADGGGAQEVVDLLTKSIGRKALLQFSRVVALAGDDPTVGFFLKNVPVEDGERGIQRTDLFGMQIEEGVVFRAKRPARAKNLSKVAHSTSRAWSQNGARKRRIPAGRALN